MNIHNSYLKIKNKVPATLQSEYSDNFELSKLHRELEQARKIIQFIFIRSFIHSFVHSFIYSLLAAIPMDRQLPYGDWSTVLELTWKVPLKVDCLPWGERPTLV